MLAATTPLGWRSSLPRSSPSSSSSSLRQSVSMNFLRSSWAYRTHLSHHSALWTLHRHSTANESGSPPKPKSRVVRALSAKKVKILPGQYFGVQHLANAKTHKSVAQQPRPKTVNSRCGQWIGSEATWRPSELPQSTFGACQACRAH